MKKNEISKQEIRGTKDWTPEEMSIRKYIFDKWRQVCESYAFSEYLTPLLENADIYRAKSGEDVGGKELMIFQDQGGRELAIRPEMTPSVVRMVSKYYASAHKPLKLFSIANFVRNEKPQRGRNREFWQLNCDIFGEENILSDLEILQMSIDIVLAFDPPENSFILKLNNRKLIDSLFDVIGLKEGSEKTSLMRLMDKFSKLNREALLEEMKKEGLKEGQIETVFNFMEAEGLEGLAEKIPELKTSPGFMALEEILGKIKKINYDQYVKFSPDIIRGFDYYDGLVFEVFDMNPENNRAMFGGGRYNGLANIFGVNDFPAVGIAPGDETFKLFLESWKLLPTKDSGEKNYFLPILSEKLESESFLLAQKLRREGSSVEMGFNVVKISRALEYANKKNISYVVILGEDEKDRGVYKIKDMESGEEKKKDL
jgi:histidyl-tRNA synthetase